MAFIDQVQDLTSLTVSDNDELSQFLKDGVIDVTNRWLLVRPQDIDLFIRVSGEQTANDSLALNGVKIINVVREDGTNNQWRNCRKISPSLQYDVTDVDSLNYASKINPAYTLLHNGKVNVFPSAAIGGANSFKVYYVNNEPTDLTNNAALIHSHSDIQYFPADKVYLVVIYAGMKLLQANMGATTITDLSVTAVPPDVPSLSTSSVSFSQAAPTLTTSTLTSRVAFNDYWVIGDFPDSDPGELSVTAVPPDTPDTPELSSVGAAPTYNNSIASSEFGGLATFIDTDEDVELATAKVQEINALIQNELNEFNEANILFQATIQRETQEDTLILQKYQADLAVYQAEVGSQVQEYTQKLQRYQAELTTVYQAWAKTESDSLQQYQLDIQANLNQFNEDNAEYMAQLQISIKNADLDNQEDARKLQKYQAEYAGYTAEVTSQVQEYTQNLQADGMGYQWLQGQYAALKAEYDAAFMIAAPKQQPQQQARV